MEESKIILDKNLLNKTLESGGVIAFVTDTVWGLGCLPNNKTAVDKIYKIKGRDTSKPLILMSDSIKNLLPYINSLSEQEKEITDNYFPGAVTLVTKKSEKTPIYITSGKDTIGIRVPDNMFFKTLCGEIKGHVLATTSANLSNHPSSKTYLEAKNSIGAMADIVYQDFGYKCQGLESTVITIINNKINILRQGSIVF